MSYDLKFIRQLIREALTTEEFNDLVSDDFPEVAGQFTNGQEQSQRIRTLINYADKHREIDKLLESIKNINPIVYEEYVPKLGIPENSPTNTQEDNLPPKINRCDILILAANPINTQKLQLEKEAELIRERLQENEIGRQYIVKDEATACIEDLSKYLLQYEPIILHFSGHGNSNGEIILNNRQDQAQVVSIETLAELLSTVGGRIECVVLNACFSLEKADAIAEQVSCVIGMDKEIDDESALRFAGGFYRGLGFGRGYYSAFELGRNEIKILQLPDNQVPHFITRDTLIFQSQLEEVVKQRITRSDLIVLETLHPHTSTATLYPLWFGTNRKPVDIQDISKGFSKERDGQIHYGICQVAVPESHKIGSTGSPWWQRLLTSTDDRLKLQPESLKVLDEIMFWDSVQKALQEHEPDENSALVFIHGFNVSFEDAALRAAQIGFDLQVPGIMAFYSWPSQAKLMGYTADEATIEASEQYIAEFLLNLSQKTQIGKIHIIAHSMGNRGLLRAMQRILAQVQAASEVPFGQIVLAAPDVDPDLFRDLAKAYHTLAERTTLYVSSKDKALSLSGIIHDYPRVGFFPPVTVVEGIDTIQVSKIDLTFLGHGYFADARTLLEDIRDLLIHNTPPNRRQGRLEPSIGGNYWIIRG
ncbi:alpha/beta hydrolase [Anabaena cylindrica UHCC 0172]|uniref:alpha/beta hydrolase n=1 Tax=Anabaena cylindrica TaxID=1165 RepID=UPI002B2025E9|nr:alpha/beta hydrolase [Anabaena cylindrica]MEA5553292.1 alpha/beta hydrolase [Anabaena cylindrica UHCC 0172]